MEGFYHYRGHKMQFRAVSGATSWEVLKGCIISRCIVGKHITYCAVQAWHSRLQPLILYRRYIAMFAVGGFIFCSGELCNLCSLLHVARRFSYTYCILSSISSFRRTVFLLVVENQSCCQQCCFLFKPYCWPGRRINIFLLSKLFIFMFLIFSHKNSAFFPPQGL